METTLIKAMIFDFDGLMLDTEQPSFDVWQKIYRDHGATLDKDLWVSCVGANYDVFHPCTHLEELIGKKVDHQELIDLKNRMKAEICDTLPLMPGVLGKIAEAQKLGLRLAIASSSPRDWIEHHTQRCDIRKDIEVIAAGSEVERTKPSPDVYLLAARRLEIDPKHCLVFEDSKNGVVAANAAGMTAVAVPNSMTKSLDFSQAHAVMSSLDERSLEGIIQTVVAN